jgi:hypothetical protein
MNCIAREVIPDDTDSDADFVMICLKCYRDRGNVEQEPEAEQEPKKAPMGKQ